MSELTKDRVPDETPRPKGVRGSVFLASFVAIGNGVLLIVTLFNSGHDRLWPRDAIFSAVTVVFWVWQLIVIYRRPVGEVPSKRHETLVLAIVGLVLAVAVAGLVISSHLYGSPIQP